MHWLPSLLGPHWQLPLVFILPCPPFTHPFTHPRGHAGINPEWLATPCSTSPPLPARQ